MWILVTGVLVAGPANAIDTIEISTSVLRFIGDEPHARAGSTLGESFASLSVIGSTLGIGAHYADPNGNASAGAAYFMTTTMTPGEYPLGDASFTVLGAAADDRAGYAISGRGDVNGDGTQDIAIGAWGVTDSLSFDTGALYVFFGGVSLADSAVTDSADLVIHGQSSLDHLGWSVDLSGDVNGDAINDIVVGAPLGQGGAVTSGEVFVFFGRADFVSGSELSPDSADVHLYGVETLAGYGHAVTVGDVNNDLIGDIIIGAPSKDFASRFNAGGVFGFLGRADWSADDSLAIDNDYDFRILGANSNDQFGSTLDVIRDVNGDGFNDILVAAPLATPNGPSSGRIYIFGGGNITNPISLDARTNAATIYNGDLPGDVAGTSLTAVRDVDGNGTQEILIGAPGADPMGRSGAGTAFLILTPGGAFPPGGNLTVVATRAYIGENPGDEVGAAVKALIDFNGDGTNDFAIGAPGVDNGANLEAGAAYVVTGDAFVAVPETPVAALIGVPFPNPTRNSVRIPFRIANADVVTMRIHDVSGRLVRTLVDGERVASRSVLWDGRNERGTAVAPGVYFFRLETPDAVATRRLTVVR